MKFSILIFKGQIDAVKYSVGQMNRYEKKIMILEEINLSGVQSGEPDMQLILFLCSENLFDIFRLGWDAAKQPITFKL
jgi:hypothetical protein